MTKECRSGLPGHLKGKLAHQSAKKKTFFEGKGAKETTWQQQGGRGGTTNNTTIRPGGTGVGVGRLEKPMQFLRPEAATQLHQVQNGSK